MFSNDFEKAFSDFLEQQKYDQAEAALFSIVRIAFIAGWKSAGSGSPNQQKVFTLFPKTDVSNED